MSRSNELLSVTSHGTAIMLRFFLGVWRNENRHEFDILMCHIVTSYTHNIYYVK